MKQETKDIMKHSLKDTFKQIFDTAVFLILITGYSFVLCHLWNMLIAHSFKIRMISFGEAVGVLWFVFAVVSFPFSKIDKNADNLELIMETFKYALIFGGGGLIIFSLIN